MSQAQDRELISRLQRGDQDALGELYARHQGLVFRTALAVASDPEVASDLLHDVFLRLYRFADQVDPERPLEPWLYRVTANLAYTYLKRRKRWLRRLQEMASWWLVKENERAADRLIVEKEDWTRVQKALSSLPFSQRVVVVLYYINDLSIKEISAILDIPVGTVKSRLHYGRQALKKELGLDRGMQSEVSFEFS